MRICCWSGAPNLFWPSIVSRALEAAAISSRSRRSVRKQPSTRGASEDVRSGRPPWQGRQSHQADELVGWKGRAPGAGSSVAAQSDISRSSVARSALSPVGMQQARCMRCIESNLVEVYGIHKLRLTSRSFQSQFCRESPGAHTVCETCHAQPKHNSLPLHTHV